jgi:hypothetical protein
MSAKDIFHDAVRNGLEKEGWVITDDPLRIRAGRVDMQIDLGAKRIIAAEKGEQKIAVEIKSFISPSNISEFHTALGQFLNYRVALEEQQPDRVLYLAVPQGAYKTFFNKLWGFKSPASIGSTFCVGVKSPLQNVIANCELRIANWFNLPFVETVIERFQLRLVVYDPNDEVILEWKR